MAKTITGYLKIQVKGGEAKPGPRNSTCPR